VKAAKNRKLKWPILIVVGIGAIPLFALGIWGYVIATTTPIHPKPQDVKSVTNSAPSPRWADAVEQARQIVRATLTEQNLPGASVAVGIGSELVWAEGFGWADIEDHVPVAPNTRFKIGTASKVLTSAAVGLLLQQGRLKLDDEIQTYVPAFPKKQWPVTLRQLMGHLSGVSTDSGDEEPREEHCDGTLDALPRFAESSLRFEPGTQYRYSNYGWILVSGAVESAAGQPFLMSMSTNIFEPLGMNDTKPDSEDVANRATFYFPRFAADPRYGPEDPFHVDYSCFTGSGTFLSTPSDLVRFAMAINSGKLLQPATVQLLQTSQRLPSGEETGYGLGWDLETVTLAGEQTRTVGHDGEVMGGRLASLMTFRERGIVVAVTSNIAFSDTSALAVKIAQAFAGPGKNPAGR
jgi:serine beta-lactamase-like protein LACTB, mitochondrial